MAKSISVFQVFTKDECGLAWDSQQNVEVIICDYLPTCCFRRVLFFGMDTKSKTCNALTYINMIDVKIKNSIIKIEIG